MLKKNIKITNVYGQEETKVLHFNLTRMEVYELQKKYKEGYESHVKNVMDSGDQNSQLNVFTELVKAAYCEIDDEGNVIKSKDLLNKFEHSEAYSELMFELLDKDDTKKAEAFFRGIMPQQLISEIDKRMPSQNHQQNQNNQPRKVATAAPVEE